MANQKVSLRIRIKTNDGTRRYAGPVFAANGRLRPFYALVEGKAEFHPGGVYNLRYRREGRRVWEPVGNDPTFALAARLKRERTLEAISLGIEVKDVDQNAKRVKLADAIAEYLAD